MRDGAMARLRLPGGRLRADAAVEVARAARRLGSGRIDLTNRANLQLRGLDSTRIGALHEMLRDIGLMPETPAADRLRNVVASPLGGASATALVAEIDAALQAAAPSLDGVPVKACVVVDGGGGDVIGLGHDVGLLALDGDHWQASLAGRPQPVSLSPQDAPAFVLALFAAMARRRARLSALLTDTDAATLMAGAGIALAPLSDAPPHWPEPSARLGRIAEGALAARAPLDGLDADRLAGIAALAAQGDGLLRLAPERRIVIAGLSRQALADTEARAIALGFGTTEPAIRTVSCIGARGCARTVRDVRGDAVRLTDALAARTGLARATVHLTGCARGCARAEPSDWVLRAEGDGYALFASAKADVARAPLARLAPTELAEHLAIRLDTLPDAA